MNKKITLIMMTTMLLQACGGGGDAPPAAAAAPASTAAVNVALPSNGASVSATYGAGSIDGFVNDGDSTTTTNYWAGNISGDSVTIDFGRIRSVESVTVYTNDLSFSSASPKKVIEVSLDGNTWLKTAQITGGDIACPTFTTSSSTGRIYCAFASAQSLRYFRVRVPSATPADQHIIEMEAMGR